MGQGLLNACFSLHLLSFSLTPQTRALGCASCSADGTGGGWVGGYNTTGHTGCSGRQKELTRRSTRREGRLTVKGPVKRPQPDEMSHREGGGGVMRATKKFVDPKWASHLLALYSNFIFPPRKFFWFFGGVWREGGGGSARSSPPPPPRSRG